ncbi:CPBP family intramembrane glutamic endopeptidase [Thermoactinospora rubra]|uniref:CPBP family intramembrane glutamic endopeptidase n=1 Tax=Thermoactinospora rubra TaxID=1088767 RepID=UPI00117CF388|nr:CPBP family intramembrane glutamic endopeptidase [Thermoactinospora rubra]
MQENQQPFPQGQPYPAALAYTPPAPQPWLLPPPEGVRYDHLARNPATRWWRPVVGTLVVAVAFVVAAMVVFLLGALLAPAFGVKMLPGDTRLFDDPEYALVVMLLSIAVVLPLVFGTAALIQRRRPGTLSSVAGRLRWSWLWGCAGVAVVALVLGQTALVVAYSVAGEDTSGLFGEWAGWERFLPGLVVIVLLVPFQAAAEEYIFRGWVIQAFGSYLRNPAYGIVLGSLLFMVMHGYTQAGMVDVFGFGVVMGFLAVRTGGLEAAIAMHVVNNVFAFGLSAATGQLDKAMQQGAVPWPALAGTVVQLAVFAAGVLLLAKKLAKKRAISAFSG